VWDTERVFYEISPKTQHRAKKCICERKESLFKYVKLPSESILKRAVKFLSHTRKAKKTYSWTRIIKLTSLSWFRAFSTTLLRGYVRNEKLSGIYLC